MRAAMRLGIALIAALALPAAAAAQPQVDPRQASGIARPEPNDPAGTITVRVVQGRFSSDAFGNSTTKFPPGQVVHLVAVSSAGDVALISKPAGDEGRAVFSGLATDGSFTYYATAVVPRGELDDVLTGKTPLTPPPQAGLRLMLAGPDPDSGDPAVDDRRDPRLPPLDAGDVVVDVRGLYESVDQITLREVGGPWTATVRTSPLQDARIGRFTGVAGGNAHVYVAEVVVDGRLYRSEPLQISRAHGGYASVFVYPNLLVQFHSGAEVDDQKLWFQIQFTMANLTGSPFDPGPEGIVIPLPVGTVNASVDDQDPRVRVDKERGAYVWKGSFPPGQEQFVGQFALPIEDGQVDVTMPLPYGTIESQLSMRVRSGLTDAIAACVADGKPKAECDKTEIAKLVTLTAPAGAPTRFRTLQDGVTFLVLPQLNVPAGGQLHVVFKGLPSPPAWIEPAEWVVGFTVVAFLALTIVGLGFASRRAVAGAGDGRRAELLIERDKLFGKLVAVERRHRDAKLHGRVLHGDERSELKDKLVAIDEELRGSR